MSDRLEGYIKPGTPEYEILKTIDFARLPVHVAVIMDGNGRWARKRGISRIEGHKAGAESVREVVEAGARLGLKYLTLYAFSSENWKRPADEVRRLWGLLRNYLKNQDRVLVENDLKLRIIGRQERIPASVLRELRRVERLTENNKRMTVVMALNYGGRTEIVDAARRLLAERAVAPDRLDEDTFGRYLYTAGLPDPDLLIRTSAEQRISNFLLWQIAYTELWITDVLWPDFRRLHLLQAIADYQKRERRFGDVTSGPATGADRGPGQKRKEREAE